MNAKTDFVVTQLGRNADGPESFVARHKPCDVGARYIVPASRNLTFPP